MNINQIRLETLGCHNKIFFNSAGSSLMPKIVSQKMLEYANLEEQEGGYELAAKSASQISEFYSEAAQLLNCKPENIAVMFNATNAYSKALSSVPFAAGDVILTTSDDYVSNQLSFISLKKRFGILILKAKNLPNGDIDFDDFEHLVKTQNPKLVAVTHLPTSSGLIQNAEKVGEICNKYDVLFLLDACQSVGQIVVDVQKIKCDFLSATGRKFLRGPRGTGFLYVSDKVIHQKLEPLFIDLKGAVWTSENTYEVIMNAKRFEEWEFSHTNLIGLTEAIRYANEIGIDKIQERNASLCSVLRENLAKIPHIKVLDKGTNLSSIVTFYVAGCELQRLCDFLKTRQVYYSVVHKEFALLDLTKKGIDWAIRFSPHYFNTFEEIEVVINTLKEFCDF